MTTDEHRKACLRRYYKDMPLSKAKFLKSQYANQSAKKAKIFVKRINAAKGYKAL